MILEKLKNIFEEVLDRDPEMINENTYVIRDLLAESIDLLELAVHIGQEFKIEVNDQVMFLRHLRSHTVDGAENIRLNFPYLREGRAEEMMQTLEGGPVLKVADLIDYIKSSESSKSND